MEIIKKGVWKVEMCKIIHPSKLSNESYKVFRELLPIMYEEVSGKVILLQKVSECGKLTNIKSPVILIDQKISSRETYYRLPLDNGVTYKDGERITVWVLRECLVV